MAQLIFCPFTNSKFQKYTLISQFVHLSTCNNSRTEDIGLVVWYAMSASDTYVSEECSICLASATIILGETQWLHLHGQVVLMIETLCSCKVLTTIYHRHTLTSQKTCIFIFIIGLRGLHIMFTSLTQCCFCSSMRLCGRNFVQTIYPLLKILVKNLTNHFPVNLQLILHQFQGHLMISGHKLTNCCTLFLNFEQLMGSLTLDQVGDIHIPI